MNRCSWMATRLAGTAILLSGGLILAGLSGGAVAQTAPLSAIDWLSSVVEHPETYPDSDPGQITHSAQPPAILTTALEATSLDAVGMLPASVAQLPEEFWGTASSATLGALISQLRTDLPAPLARLLHRILLAELVPPVDSSGTARLFLARVDRLLKQGALDQAQALLDRAGTERPSLFARSFDISLLSEDDITSCDRVLDDAALKATISTRIFCLVREGDWEQADTLLQDAQDQATLDPALIALLARFVAPETAENAAPLPAPDRITPLSFRLHKSIGEPLGTATLPNAFAYSALSETSGWKTRIAAAERLARSRSIPNGKLLAIYSERQAAASGGLWDRVDAVQALERALNAGDISDLAERLPIAVQAMRRAGLETALADLFAKDLLALPLDEATAIRAVQLGLLSDDYGATRETGLFTQVPLDPLIRGLATGQLAGVSSDEAIPAALLDAFRATSAGGEIDQLLEAGNPGQAVLQAINLLEDGANAAPQDIERGIAALRLVGLDDTARAMALSIALSQ